MKIHVRYRDMRKIKEKYTDPRKITSDPREIQKIQKFASIGRQKYPGKMQDLRMRHRETQEKIGISRINTEI
jgi:hypothetical protein